MQDRKNMSHMAIAAWAVTGMLIGTMFVAAPMIAYAANDKPAESSATSETTKDSKDTDASKDTATDDSKPADSSKPADDDRPADMPGDLRMGRRGHHREDLTNLSEADQKELQELYDKMDAQKQTSGLTDEELERLETLEEKAHLANMKATLSDSDYAEYEKLYEKESAVQKKVKELYEKEGLSDEERERFDSLEEQVYGQSSRGKGGPSRDAGGPGQKQDSANSDQKGTDKSVTS